ncbi:MAG: tetratricopeptide repeat protein [Candidatus Heimdallarchaeota archaeon]
MISLSSTIEKQFLKIEQLIIHGKFKEGLSVIEDGLKKKDISKEEELSFLIFKSEVAWYLGNVQETLQLAELVLKESKGLANVLLQLDALIWIVGYSLFGKVSKGLENAEKGLEIISTATNLPAKAIAKRKAQLLLLKAQLITLYVGDFEKSLELVKEALSFAEESGYKNVISNCLIIIGGTYFFLGETKKGEEHSEKALDIAIEIGNKFYIAFSYLFGLVKVKVRRREYEQALDLYNKAFNLSEEIGSTYLLFFKNDMGLVYRDMFQLDKALECFQESLKYSVGFRNIAYVNIGYIHFLKYELEKAQEYYLKSMKICEEINDRRILPYILFSLVLVSLELKKFTQAQKYLKRLEQISKETGFDRIGRTYRFASILVLKASGDISDLVEAIKLLRSFLVEEDLPSFWRLDALYSLLEIRIKELQLSARKETFEEVLKRLHHLEVEAEEQQFLWLLANVYRLQSQLALIELDSQKAIELLDKAQVIADEISIDILKVKLKDDREKINQQLGMLQKLLEQQAPLSETIKLASLDNTVQSIKHDTVLEERDKESGKIIEYRKLFVLKL